MKRFAILAALVAAFFSCALLAGCASSPTAAQNVQSAIALGCPYVKSALSVVTALPSLSGQARVDLASAQTEVAALCAGNETVDTSNLSALVKTSIPALEADVQALPLTDDQKTKTTTILMIAGATLQAAVDLVQTSAQSAAGSSD